MEGEGERESKRRLSGRMRYPSIQSKLEKIEERKRETAKEREKGRDKESK